MKFSYGEAGDGELFQSPDELFAQATPPKLMEFILQHGEDGLEALDESEQAQELIEQLLVAGLLEGFGRQLITDTMLRYGIGTVMLLFWLGYYYVPRRGDVA